MDQKEIDLVLLYEGKLHFVECESGIAYSKKDISSFDTLAKATHYEVGGGYIVCLTDVIYPLGDGYYAIPTGSI